KPVVAVSGRTTSSAPVASTQRVNQSTHFSRLARTPPGLSGPFTGAIWMAAAVKARTSAPASSDAHGHPGDRDGGAGQSAVDEVLAGNAVALNALALERRAPSHGRAGGNPDPDGRSGGNSR